MCCALLPPLSPSSPPPPNRAKPDEYTALIKAGDAAGLMELLTDVKVERMVVERVRLKAATFGRDINPAGAATPAAAGGAGSKQDEGGEEDRHFKIQPDVLASMYDTIVMPLTKEVQVEYLLHRLDHEQ